jgi:ribonuclease HII
MIYAGIDEAGYGPVIGPLVVARTVFELPSWEPGAIPPSLWSSMQSAVCRKSSDKRNRIAVNDSKALYNAACGMKHLERGVLAFLQSIDSIPSSLDELLQCLGFDKDSFPSGQPWYIHEGGGPGIPVDCSASRLKSCFGKLKLVKSKTGIRLKDIKAAVVFEDRFNRLVNATGSKAACSWIFVAGHLNAIWERFGQARPFVVIDRQGGRTTYRDILQEAFPEAEINVCDESFVSSRYNVSDGINSMDVIVRICSEAFHLPVALASMTAKYVRELLMIRMHLFWGEQAPHVRPTAGYFKDGRRFIREIEPLFPGLCIDRECLVRCR